MYTPVNPSFTIEKWVLRGSKLYRHVFAMVIRKIHKVPFRCAYRSSFTDSDIFSVSTNCNYGNSFRCGYTHCIPNGYKCDGITDCMDGEDERDCTLPNSCQEWWDAGYQTSGIYTICEFTNNIMKCLCQKR